MLMKTYLKNVIVFFILLLLLLGCSVIEENADINGSDTTNNQTLQSEEEDHNNEEDPGENDNHKRESLKEKIDIYSDDSVTVLVNKFNSLSDSYIPNDLVTLSVRTVLQNPEINQLRKEAADALTTMFAAAEKDEVYLYARSGYRSFATQTALFNNYTEQNGIEAAMRFSAKPGFSEHQTGLVMDVTSESVELQLSEQFEHTKEGKWVQDNAHRFGFIIRYPKGKEDITGYIYEPWHLRYLGIDVATAVYESGLTYEEFLQREELIDAYDYEKATKEAN